MKKLLFLLLIVGCTPTQDYMVQSEENLSADFSEYSTYEFSTHAKNTNVMYTMNDMELKQAIREAVAYEMQAKGYDRAPANADILVNFRVFDEDTEIRGYENDAEYWMESEIREWEDIKTYEVDAGTLYVDFVDKSTGKMIWRGFASGIMNPDNMTVETESIATAVEKIFNEYEHRGEAI